MKDYAENLEFEKAEMVEKKSNSLKRYQSKSVIVNDRISLVT